MAKIEINEALEISIWFDEMDYPGAGPNLLQPCWPDGTEWASLEEAKAWADAYVKSIEDSTAPLAGSNPKNPTIPRPKLDEIQEAPLPTPVEIQE